MTISSGAVRDPVDRPAGLGRHLLSGGLAGLTATSVMSLSMLAMFPLLPRRDRYPLPPERLTKSLLRRVGWRFGPRQERIVFVVAHFGYGALTGAIYGPTAGRLSGPPAGKGILYGLVVWAASYQGWIPALGLLRPAGERPLPRNALMIAAHAVWGSTLGVAEAWLHSGRGGPLSR